MNTPYRKCTKKMVKRKYAGIASLPERERALIHAVRSIADQVDEVFVALNGYDSIPKQLQSLCNVKCELLDNSLGDAAKFLHVGDIPDGIYFSIDDDLEYPKGYVAYMIRKIEQYNAVVTLHGRQYGNRPPKSFRRGWTLNYHCLHSYTNDVPLDLGGTGVMAHDTSMVRATIADFPIKNMADIWMAKLCHERGVKIMGVAHSRSYLTYMAPANDNTIWRTSTDDSVQTRVLQSFLK